MTAAALTATCTTTYTVADGPSVLHVKPSEDDHDRLRDLLTNALQQIGLEAAESRGAIWQLSQTIFVTGQLMMLPCLKDPVFCYTIALSAFSGAANTASTAAKSALEIFHHLYRMLDGKQSYGWLAPCTESDTVGTFMTTIGGAAALLLALLFFALKRGRRNPQQDPEPIHLLQPHQPQPELQPIVGIAEPHPQPPAHPEPEPQPQAQPEPQAQAQPQAHAQPEPQPQAQPEPQPQAQPQPQLQPQAQPQPQPYAAFADDCFLQLESQVLLPTGLANNIGLMQALHGKRVGNIIEVLRNPGAAWAVYNRITIADMVDPHTSNVDVKLRNSTALALILAFHFPTAGNNAAALVDQLQRLRNELRRDAALDREYGVGVRRVYGDRRTQFHAQLETALDLPDGDWATYQFPMTVTVPAVTAVAKLLLL